jgi:hypothetical protein
VGFLVPVGAEAGAEHCKLCAWEWESCLEHEWTETATRSPAALSSREHQQCQKHDQQQTPTKDGTKDVCLFYLPAAACWPPAARVEIARASSAGCMYRTVVCMSLAGRGITE